METEFTPLASLAGGAMIGAAAVLLMAVQGRIFGATGVLAGAMFGPDRTWRLAVIGGMVLGPAILWLFSGAGPAVQVPVSLPMLLGGGVLVGMGVSWGGGCTSGHGVCGLARISPRSLVATVTFMISCGATVFVIRHVLGA